MATSRRTWGTLRVRAERSYVARKLLVPGQAFIEVEGRSGVVLLAAALVALAWANSPWAGTYFALREARISIDLGIYSIAEDLQHWINDGLMTVFFFLVGLEIKRELVQGGLSEARRAALPVAAALGGMIVPALIYFAWNPGGEAGRGWGIPMATDIAFALGVLALLGRRIPSELRVLLLALAVVDDVGAILVIAVFYTDDLSMQAIWIALLVVPAIVVLRLSGARSILVYAIAAVVFWAAVHDSGVHATIAGVILGALTPARPWFSVHRFERSMEELLGRFQEGLERRNEEDTDAVLGEVEELTRGTEAPLDRVERMVHPWSSYLVLPLFALANAGLPVTGGILREAVASPVTWGVFAGLLLGKPLGAAGFAWGAVRLGLAETPAGVTWPHLIGMGLLAGIGFTVSLFITGLAFTEAALLSDAKLGILAASAVAGLAGYLFLRYTVAREGSS